MFENGVDGDGDGDGALDSMPPETVVPEVAWAAARRFVEGDPESDAPWIPIPDWCVIDGQPQVAVDAAAPKDAWEQAANWSQEQLDEIEVLFRRAERDRTLAMLTAFETSMRDLRLRFGLADGSEQTHGARAFHRQTALALGTTPHQVAGRIAAATTARRRLPQTWGVFVALRTTWRAVELAVEEADGLADEVWPEYDRSAALLVATAPMSRLGLRLRTKRERLQDDTATARARATAERRDVRFRVGRDGGGTLTYSGPVARLRAIDQALTKAAIASRCDDEPRTVTQLRFDIGTDLQVEGVKQAADPACSGWAVPKRPGVECVLAVTVPALAWLGITAEQATVEGVGPIDLETALRLAADAPSAVRILTDPVSGVRLTMDRTVYSPPADLRRWVQYRDQRCRFPGCNRAAVDCDVDHAHEWQHLGLTNDDNLVCLCRGDHIAKSLRLFQEELRADGWVDWETPWGRHVADPPPDPADPVPIDLMARDDPPPF